MSRREAAKKRLRNTTLSQLEAWLDAPMIVLGFVWFGLVLVEFIWGSGRPLEVVGYGIWLVFILEFAARFSLAPEKLPFLVRNWLSALALLVPAFRIFASLRLFKLARAVRGIRVLKVVGAANRGMNALRKSMKRRGFGYVVILTAAMALLGAAAMFALEPAGEVRGGFQDYGEALWWTAMLLTTMGTDFWPRTAEGRTVCLLLSAYAFAVWGYITASIAAFFVGQEDRSADTPGRHDIANLRAQVTAVQSEIARLSEQLTRT
jgi:voltage-gated potassium channel